MCARKKNFMYTRNLHLSLICFFRSCKSSRKCIQQLGDWYSSGTCELIKENWSKLTPTDEVHARNSSTSHERSVGSLVINWMSTKSSWRWKWGRARNRNLSHSAKKFNSSLHHKRRHHKHRGHQKHRPCGRLLQRFLCLRHTWSVTTSKHLCLCHLTCNNHKNNNLYLLVWIISNPQTPLRNRWAPIIPETNWTHPVQLKLAHPARKTIQQLAHLSP